MLRVLLSLFLCFTLAAHAQTDMLEQGERVVKVEPVVRDGKLYIDADLELAVTGDLRNAAQKGVPLYFTADLEIVSKRWWWFDKTVVNEQQTWRIVYNALTRQWRVGTGDLSLPESSLDDALSLVRNIRGWAVANVQDLEHDELYEGRIRVRLDTSLLARPFQVDAFNSSAWSLATPWKNFTFSISVDEPRH
ncbi:DUF4390 domain-containing protein [Pollutimonas sp. H1-120]|uniref:DUF4390 domain-containing protein n=1 Tax=Pollutimonas sp. H1-120 TaxID=3148824 RepID=UPI003B5198DB